MSHNDSIRNLLNIKDKNIYFDENFVSDELIKDITAKVFHAKLTYSPTYCICCGGESSNIIKYGFKASKIVIPGVSNFNTYLLLRKQKFFCKQCNQTFMAESSLVDKNCHISKSTKLAISLESKEKI